MDIQTITVVITWISVVIGVINSILSNRKADQQRQTEIETRQAELFMQIFQRINSTEWRKSFLNVVRIYEYTTVDEWNRKYRGQLDSRITMSQVGSYFAGVGVLLEQRLLDPKMIDDLMSESIIAYWEKIKPLMPEWRKINPKEGDSIEYLYNVMKQRAQQTTVTT